MPKKRPLRNVLVVDESKHDMETKPSNHPSLILKDKLYSHETSTFAKEQPAGFFNQGN